MRFRSAELERRAEIHGARHLRAGLLAHQIGEPARQLALVGAREGAIEHVGDDQAEHVVAKEFQALIAGAAIAAGQGGNVGERAVKQGLVGELVADPLLERVAFLGLAAHLTIVNSRFQRTEKGQRQNSQARSP